MATVITAGNATNGLSFTADNTGALDIKTGTGAGTTAISISSSQVVTMNGGAIYPLTSGTAVASTSGTSITFTDIPSWVKRITVMFSSVSTNGTSVIQIQIGTVSGVETSAYGGTNWQANTANTALSTGFTLGTSNAATIQTHGILQLALIGSNTWAASGNFGRANGVDFVIIGGSKALSGTLDRVRITTVNGTDTFDAGSINILYE